LIASNQSYYVLMEEKRESFNKAPTAPNYFNAIHNADNIKLIDHSQSLDNLNMNASPEEKATFFMENNKKSFYFEFCFILIIIIFYNL